MLPAENLDNKIKEFWPKNGPSIEEVEKYVKKYSKEKIVIKCGGRVLLDSALFNNFIEDIVVLKKLSLLCFLLSAFLFCLTLVILVQVSSAGACMQPVFMSGGFLRY